MAATPQTAHWVGFRLDVPSSVVVVQKALDVQTFVDAWLKEHEYGHCTTRALKWNGRMLGVDNGEQCPGVHVDKGLMRATDVDAKLVGMRARYQFTPQLLHLEALVECPTLKTWWISAKQRETGQRQTRYPTRAASTQGIGATVQEGKAICDVYNPAITLVSIGCELKDAPQVGKVIFAIQKELRFNKGEKLTIQKLV